MDIRKIPANIAFKLILPKLGKCHYEYGTNFFWRRNISENKNNDYIEKQCFDKTHTLS